MALRSPILASQAVSADRRALHRRREFSLPLPQRMVLDFLALVEVGLVVLAAVLAKYFYITFVLDSSQHPESYVAAGIAGGVTTFHLLRSRGMHTRAAFLEWHLRWRSLLVSIALSFLVLIALAYLLKLSADY